MPHAPPAGLDVPGPEYDVEKLPHWIDKPAPAWGTYLSLHFSVACITLLQASVARTPGPHTHSRELRLPPYSALAWLQANQKLCDRGPPLSTMFQGQVFVCVRTCSRIWRCEHQSAAMSCKHRPAALADVVSACSVRLLVLCRKLLGQRQGNTLQTSQRHQ